MHGVHKIAIVGAGPAGATFARLLALKGWQVSLINSSCNRLERLEVLAPSSIPLIEALSLGDVLEDPVIARPCLGIRRSWLSTKVEYDDFLRRPPGRGFVVDRRPFDDRLRLLALAAGVELIVGRVSAIRREQEVFTLEFAGAGVRSLSASLVIDATGRAAALARRLGIGRIVKERLVAERRTIDRSDLPQGDAVWLDVEADGAAWNYGTCGPDGRRERWTISRDVRQGGASAEVANASSMCLTEAAGPGWIAIGDAAAAFDPIASQGLFNALSAAMVATGIIAQRGAVAPEVAADYSAAMISTFQHSERGRAEVYAARARFGVALGRSRLCRR